MVLVVEVTQDTSRRHSHSLGIGFHDIVVFASFFSLLALQLQEFASDPGLGWHLKTGEIVATSKSIPSTDPYLAIGEGQTVRPWVSDQWLADVLLYLLYAAGDWAFAYAILLPVFAIPFLSISYRGLRSQLGYALPVSVAVFLALKVSTIHLLMRPVIFSFLFLATVMVRGRKLALSPDTPRKRDFFLLPSLFLVWANIHPTFVLGLVWLFLVPLCRVFAGERRLLPFVALPLLCLAATFVNPYGPWLHASIFELTGNEFFMNYHREWQSPSFKLLEGQLIQAMIAIPLLGSILDRKRKYAYAPFDIVGALVAGHFALESVRILPFFALALVPLTAMGIVRVGRGIESIARRPVFDMLSRLESRELRTRWAGFSVAIIAMALPLWTLVTSRLPFGPGVLGPKLQDYPYGAAAQLSLLALERPVSVISPPDWGGFLVWQGYPGLRPVIDDRNTLLGEAFYRRFYDAIRSDKELPRLVKSYPNPYLLVAKNGDAAARARCSDAFNLVYEDERTVVFAPR